jgi:hypothetical protein
MSETASSEPRLAEKETELATNPVGTEDSSTEKPATSTDMASDAATTAASGATAAAAGVKDSVFSMFGGGAKKETKVEDEDAANDRSGSAKAQKEKDDDEVCYNCASFRIAFPWIVYNVGPILTKYFYRRTRPKKRRQMSNSSLSYISPRPSKPRPTRRPKSRHSRCEPSSSNSTETAESGKNEALVMFGYSSTRRMARLDWLCEETRLSRSAPITTVRKPPE